MVHFENDAQLIFKKKSYESKDQMKGERIAIIFSGKPLNRLVILQFTKNQISSKYWKFSEIT